MRSSIPRFAFPAMFFLSGIAGLVHETLWARYLGILLGHTAYGQILTLTVYMGGIALGSFLGAKVLRTGRSPLALFLAAEAGVCLGGGVFHQEFLWLRGNLMGSGLLEGSGSTMGMFLAATVGALLTLPWSILIGTTFPLGTAAAMERGVAGGSSSIATLYFANTLGAALGAVLDSYLLVPRWGTQGALLVAATLNGASCLGAVVLLLRTSPDPAPRPALASSAATPESKVAGAILGLAFFTGFSSFLYEIGWIRYISLLLGASTHSFDLLVGAFVLGLALGGWYARGLGKEDTSRSLLRAQAAMAFFATLGVVGYAVVFATANHLHLLLQKTAEGYLLHSLAKFAICLALVAPTAFFAGTTLPLVAGHLVESKGDPSQTGRVYGWNTLGSILGAVAGGLALLPLLGFFRTIALGATIDVGLAAWILVRTRSCRIPSSIALVAVSAGFAIAAWAIRPADEIVTAGVFRRHTDFAPHGDIRRIDGRTATISVHSAANAVVLKTNGKADASIGLTREFKVRGDDLTQALMAFLPRAWMDRPYRAAMIGFGSGMSAHHLLGDPRLTSLDVVEIEPAVVELAKEFLPHNRRAYKDPRIHVFYQDARIFFGSGVSKYDLVVSEPSNPWVSGVSSLFTDEFYREARLHIAPGGVFVQWLNLYGFNDSLLLSALHALHRNFPHFQVHTWPQGPDMVLVASDSSLPPPHRLELDLEEESLLACYALSPRDIPGALVTMTERTLVPLMDDIAANSEFAPFLDNHSERAMYLGENANLFKILSEGEFPPTLLEADSSTLDRLLSRRRFLLRTAQIPGYIGMYKTGILAKPRLDSSEIVQMARLTSTLLPSWTWWRGQDSAIPLRLMERIQAQGLSGYDVFRFKFSFHHTRGARDSAEKDLEAAVECVPRNLSGLDRRDLLVASILYRRTDLAERIIRSGVENDAFSLGSPDLAVIRSSLAKLVVHR